MKTGATLNRGKSNQSYETPDDFINAVKEKFGTLHFDLAASSQNAKSCNWFDCERDSLKQDWNDLGGTLWLNPPFANIAPWAKKCSEHAGSGKNFGCSNKILFLVPASVGSNWFRDYVNGNAKVYFLNGRLTFKGCTQPYPKDCMLCVFENKKPPGQVEVWKWNNPKPN